MNKPYAIEIMEYNRELGRMNDGFRSAFLEIFWYFSENIKKLPTSVIDEIINRVRKFDDFKPDDDPFGERDFGQFTLEGIGEVTWCICHYDLTLNHFSEDMYDPNVTLPIMKIMFESELDDLDGELHLQL